MPFSFSERGLVFLFLSCGVSCSLLATRPVQEMSLTSAALRAAHEVQADTLSPEYFRQASDWFEQAKSEYRFKNFHLAKKYADQARIFAEKAELHSLMKGGVRAEESMPDPLGNGVPKAPESLEAQKSSTQEPYAYPSPTPVSVDSLEQKPNQDPNAANPMANQNGGGNFNGVGGGNLNGVGGGNLNGVGGGNLNGVGGGNFNGVGGGNFNGGGR